MRLIFPAFLSFVLVGCGPNALDGSIANKAPLEFNDLLLRKQGTDMVVQYQHRSGSSVQIVLKLAIDMNELPSNRKLRGDDFLKRVSISRAMLDNSQFPQVLHGALTFDRLKFEHGGQVIADFSTVFVDETTLHGQFVGKVVEVLVE